MAPAPRLGLDSRRIVKERLGDRVSRDGTNSDRRDTHMFEVDGHVFCDSARSICWAMRLAL